MAREIEILQPSFYKDFSCIGPACTDNCCHTWRIDVDKEHYLMYRKVRDAAFRETCAAVLKKKRKDATDAFYAPRSAPPAPSRASRTRTAAAALSANWGPRPFATPAPSTPGGRSSTSPACGSCPSPFPARRRRGWLSFPESRWSLSALDAPLMKRTLWTGMHPFTPAAGTSCRPPISASPSGRPAWT